MLPHSDARMALDALPTTQVELIEGAGHQPAARGHRPLLELLLPFGTDNAAIRLRRRRRGYALRDHAPDLFSLTLALFVRSSSLRRRPRRSRASPPASAAAGTDVSGLTLAGGDGQALHFLGEHAVHSPLSTRRSRAARS